MLQDATLNIDSPLTLERLCNWHGALFPTGFSGMHRIDIGALRSVPMEIVSGAIGHTKVHYAAPPPAGMAIQVDAFLMWFNQTHPKGGSQPMDGLVRAAIAHHGKASRWRCCICLGGPDPFVGARPCARIPRDVAFAF